MITKLILDEKYKNYLISEEPKQLSNLNRINVFIGQNNSGKSRFLRTLFADGNLEFAHKKADWSDIISILSAGAERIEKLFKDHHIIDAENILIRIRDIKSDSKGFTSGNVSSKLKKVKDFFESIDRLKQFGSIAYVRNHLSLGGGHENVASEVRKIASNMLSATMDLLNDEFEYSFDKIYIPILRGLRPVQLISSGKFSKDNYGQTDVYKHRTITDYFYLNLKDAFEDKIFTGLGFYEDTKRKLLGKKEDRAKIKEFEEFMSNAFFDSLPVTLIPDIENDILLIGIGKDEYPVSQLGDGIQSLIILLYPLFFNREKNLLVFIEEPENFMHPGMQRLFLETLMKEEFKNYQFYLTTHSNHFLDLTLDLDSISIYTFKKSENEPGGHSTYLVENSSNDDIKVLDMIGVRNASVFLSNSTIWVEGITDRLYLKRYLEVYQEYMRQSTSTFKIFKEDIHFSFVEYAGANIVHWSFGGENETDKIRALRLSNKIFVIADKDATDENKESEKAKRLSALKEKLKDNLWIVNGREIENTLSINVLSSVIKKLEEDDNIELQSDSDITDSLSKTSIGVFIDTHFKGIKRKYASNSGTILQKVKFCKLAINQIHSYKDLSEEAKKIAETIYNFVKLANV